jgi:group I intron endonuclease
MSNQNIKKSGVYAIVNNITGKMYIGSTKMFIKRFTYHKNELIKNKHHSIKLQRSYNKYGGEFFEFIILEEVLDKNELYVIEQNWLNKTQVWIDGYNISPYAGNYQLAYDNKQRASKEYIVISPTDEQYNVFGLNDFCEEHNLDASGMTKVAKGIYNHVKGWRCFYKELAPTFIVPFIEFKNNIDQQNKIIKHKIVTKMSEQNIKTYTVVDPNNNIFLIKNLKMFCKKNNLKYSSMLNISIGYQSQHKGWQCFLGKKTETEIPLLVKKIWTIVSPTGVFYSSDSLKKLCVEHNLRQSNMSNVAAGRIQHHKGWGCFYK